MYFTREPVIETVITAREGYKLLIRNTKGVNSEEPFIVEALELVSLGEGCFFRNSDRSKMFLIPVGDYEVIEVKDARVSLKIPGFEKGIKIAGGRTSSIKTKKEEVSVPSKESTEGLKNKKTDVPTEPVVLEKGSDGWKKDSKNRKRKEKVREEGNTSYSQELLPLDEESLRISGEELKREKRFSLLPPPTALISEAIIQYEEKKLNQNDKEEEEQNSSKDLCRNSEDSKEDDDNDIKLFVPSESDL